MKLRGKKKLLGAVIIFGALAISLILVLNRSGAPRVNHYEATDGDTIKALLSDGDSFLIRYAAVNAPGNPQGHVQTLGRMAFELNKKLIQDAQETGNLIVDLKPSDQGNKGEDTHKRPLAHVFVGTPENFDNSVEVRLVSEGYARLDVRDPNDTNIASGKDFDVRYANPLITAQIQAAMDRKGWWGKDDEYADSDVVIAVIKQWSDDEIVYIINRGTEPIDLAAGWRLVDGANHELLFSDFPGCVIAPRGLLRVHSNSAANEKKGKIEHQSDTQADVYWRGDAIWNQDGDMGTLYGPHNANAVYSYTYPLRTDYWK